MLRLGADRLPALVLDPDVPIVPWDGAYAAYGPDAVAHHPEIGVMTRDVPARYNAHEVVHHAHDVERITAT